ncbi:MAG: metal ABC transporter permease [Dehalococcoidia bacterium]|nr:metal ABC transporter permease [Dehalococcoidia bacterium]
MIDYIVGPFEYSFMVRALIVSVLVGVMCPVLGAYVITRGRAFMGDALAHSVLPGMVVAFLLGISPFLAAVPAGIVIALLMGSIARRTGVSEDTSIGIIFAGMFALGLVMLSRASNVTVNIEDLLLGQVLGVSQNDVYTSLGLTALVLVGLFTFHRQLVYTTFDPVGAKVVGIRTGFIEYVLLALLALVIVIGIQAAGIVLVMAMLITPAATAYLLARRFVGVMILGAILGAISAVSGLYLSYHVDLPSGPAMALVATLMFALAALAKQQWRVKEAVA